LPNKSSDIPRRIFKAIYLILEKYHRLYGLEIYFFTGGHGPGYAGFQVAAARCFDDQNGDANYQEASIPGRTSFVTYLSDFGIPSWSSTSGDQTQGNPEKLPRTSDVVKWLESHLTLNSLFDHYEDEVSRWRSSYTVEQSEKYLLMVRLAGLLAREKGDFPRAPGQCFSDYDSKYHEKVANVQRLLGGISGRHQIMGTEKAQVGSNGLALVNGNELVNVWDLYLLGRSPEDICHVLLDAS